MEDTRPALTVARQPASPGVHAEGDGAAGPATGSPLPVLRSEEPRGIRAGLAVDSQPSRSTSRKRLVTRPRGPMINDVAFRRTHGLAVSRIKPLWVVGRVTHCLSA